MAEPAREAAREAVAIAQDGAVVVAELAKVEEVVQVREEVVVVVESRFPTEVV